MPVQYVRGVGPYRARLLGELGVTTVGDLLWYFPFRHEEQGRPQAIDTLVLDQPATVIAQIDSVRSRPSFRQSAINAQVRDATGRMRVTWFNAPYLGDRLAAGQVVRLFGDVRESEGVAQMINPRLEWLDEDADRRAWDVPRLVPVYRATEQLNSGQIAKIVEAALTEALGAVKESLPPDTLVSRQFPAAAEAIRQMHRPTSPAELARARRRLAYEELLLMQLAITLQRRFSAERTRAPGMAGSQLIDERARRRFPFSLTAAQDRVVSEISADLARERPMTRLLQGDVGSGKTVVALYAALQAVANRRQCAILAPTEVLAAQHYASIEKYLAGSRVRRCLLTGKTTPSERDTMLRAIAARQMDLIVGTQALLETKVRFASLGLVIVDEQHKFGVTQRAALRSHEKAGSSVRAAHPVAPGSGTSRPAASFRPGWSGRVGERESGRDARTTPRDPGSSTDARTRTSSLGPALSPAAQASSRTQVPVVRTQASPPRPSGPPALSVPHYLVMTATPIPRTLSMTVFGDLDVSIIDSLPPGRQPISTRVVRPADEAEAWLEVRRRIAAGEQAYVVYPLVDESETLDVKAATVEVERVRTDLLPGARVGLVHGRLKPAEKSKVMAAFKHGELDVLVSTTVIEVGVDVPNATVMAIQHAERYGLAALHQLRGRVGRGTRASVCMLFTESNAELASRRLGILCETTDGFRIAEEDLKIRGPGELLGTRQHGWPEFRVANPVEDVDLLMQARDDAARLAREDPRLADPAHGDLRAELRRRFRDKVAFIDVA
jgi:ATP-dependent DNA helicase RecG